MIRLVITILLIFPTVAFGQDIKCPKGYQPYANRCVTQRMADYISCVEASGGNRQEILEEVTEIAGQKTSTGIKASGSGTIIKGSASLLLDKASEKNLVKRMETRWFPMGMSECAKVLDRATIQYVRKEATRARKLQDQVLANQNEIKQQNQAMLSNQVKAETDKKTLSLLVVPDSIAVSPGYNKKSLIKIVNNQDFPVFQIDLQISVERGDLSVDDIKLNPKDEAKLKSDLGGVIVSHDVFGLGMITNEGKRENHIIIFDVDAHSTKEFFAEINANKARQQSKIIFKIVRSDKQQADIISFDPFKMCQGDNSDFQTYHETSKTMLGQKRYKEALLCCEKAIMRDPRSAKAHSNMGVALLFLNEPEKAIQKFIEAIEIDPKSSKSYLNLAGVLVQQHKFKDAEEKLKVVLALNGPEQPDAFVLWGQCLALQNDADGAIGKFKKATELNPEFGPAYFHWGILYKNNGDCEKAIEKFQKAALCNDDVRLDSYGMWGSCLERLGQYTEALEKYQKIIEIAPKSVAANKSRNSIKQLREKH